MPYVPILRESCVVVRQGQLVQSYQHIGVLLVG